MTLNEEIKWLESYLKKQVKEGADVFVLRSIYKRLKALAIKEVPSPYHNAAMGVYFDWLRTMGLPEVRNSSQGQAMKSILAQLKNASTDRTDEAAFESFKVILRFWGRLNTSLQQNKQLGAINKNLLEIIDKIKHGTTKQSGNIMEAHQVHDRLRKKYDYGNGANG